MIVPTAIDQSSLDRLRADPPLAIAATELLWRASRAPDSAAYLADALPTVLLAAGGSFVAIVEGCEGRWNSLAEAGARQRLPGELLAEIMDRDAPGTRDDWIALPMALPKGVSRGVVFRCGPGAEPQAALTSLGILVPLLAEQ